MAARRAAGGRAHRRTCEAERHDVGRTLALAPAAARFADNRGQATLVFAGEVVLPDAPALPHRNAASWSSPHAVEVAFSSPFPYPGGDLCVEIDGDPVAGMASPWWPVDCALFTHDARTNSVGIPCDPALEVTAARAGMLPGNTAWLFAAGRPHTAGIVMLGAEPSLPGIPLDVIGATGCRAYVQPVVTLGVGFGAATRRAAADAALTLQLPMASHLLGATLGVQWLGYPSPVNAAGLGLSAGLRLQLASSLPSPDAVQIRSGPLGPSAPWPEAGDVSVDRFPVVRLTGR